MKAFLDACALYPPVTRRLLLSAAEAGLIAPIWSERVLEEWARAAEARHGRDAGALVRGETARLSALWPGACARAGEPEAITLPDPDDVHVLASAIAAGADLLVTLNLRDFPAPKLRRHGIEPIHPDALLRELFERAPEALAAAAQEAVEPFGEAGDGPLWRRVKRAGLPRLAKGLRRAGEEREGQAPL